VVGICDGANLGQHAASRYLGVPMERVYHELFGLNHLSWTRSIRVDPDADGTDGEEVLPSLLSDPKFVRSTLLAMFDPDLLQSQGMFLNEYLHYWYHRDEALKALLARPQTRGEEIIHNTRELLARLKEVNAVHNPETGLKEYHAILGKRHASYMAHTRNGQLQSHEVDDEDEGYAGVALNCVVAIATNTPLFTGLNVPNNGAIDGMRDDDVVEISCWVDADGPHPVQIGIVPESQYLLMRDVKRYERLAAQAILQRSSQLAVEALAAHPLIGSYPLAKTLVHEFIGAHSSNIGVWQ
jgi:6-phospho-beta-glucosidase